MSWEIYNSKGVVLSSSKAHDHTAADGSGPATNDEHDGYSEYDEIAAPSAPAANKLRLYAKDVGGASLPRFQNSEGVETPLASVGRSLRTTFWDYDDMMGNLSSSAQAGHLTAGASGAGAAWGNLASNVSHPGQWTAGTGTTAGGHCRLTGQSDNVIFSNGRVRLGVWLKMYNWVGTAAEEYQLYMGIFDNLVPVSSTDGVLIRYVWNVNGGKWQGVVFNGGGSTALDLGVVVAANTNYFLEIEVNAAGSNVEFFIDGASKGSIGSGPAANSTAEVRTGIIKTAGTTNRGAIWDAFYLEGEMTVAR